MELIVVGSNSSGNCYVLANNAEALIIECGMPFSEAKKALNYNITKVDGVLVSHEHGDHAKYLAQYERLYKVFAPALGKGSDKAVFGRFKIWTFSLNHDDVPCFGFLIEHPDMGRMVFVTDTQYVKWNFKKLNINHIICECNYQEEKFIVVSEKAAHVITGHMSERCAQEFVEANVTESLRTVIFAHLSDENADWQDVLSNMQKASDGRYRTCVAYRGLRIEVGN